MMGQAEHSLEPTAPDKAALNGDEISPVPE